MRRTNSFISLVLVVVLVLSLSAAAFAAPAGSVSAPYELKYDYTLESPSETEVYGAFATDMIIRKLDSGENVVLQLPTNGVATGYTTYKLEAENNGTFEALTATLKGRITNPGAQGVLILTLSVSTDNTNWTEVDKKTCLDGNIDYSPLEVKFPDSIAGQSVVYFKLAIEMGGGAPSYAHDWIHFTHVEFEGTQNYVPAPDDGKTRYPVTFEAGAENTTGRAPEMDDQAAGDVITLPKNKFKKTGAEFIGWSDGKNTYKAGDSYTMPGEAVTFTAQWNNFKYGITYGEAPDIATGLTFAGTAPEAAEREYAQEYIFPENPYSCEGYTFAGWRVGTRLYQPGEVFVMGTDDVVIYPYFVSGPAGNKIELDKILDDDEFAFLIQGKETDKLMGYLYDSYNMSGRASISNPEDPGYFVRQWNEVFGEGGKFDGYYYAWMTFCLDVGESKQFDDLLIRMNGRVADYGTDFGSEMNVYYSYDNENWELASNFVGNFPENGLQSSYSVVLAEQAAGHSTVYVRFEYAINGCADYAEDWVGLTAMQFEGITVDKTAEPEPSDPSAPNDATDPSGSTPAPGANTGNDKSGPNPIVIILICVAVAAVIVVVVIVIIKKKK